MRPRTIDEIVGQDLLLAPGRPLREAIDRDVLQSVILWGPPGTGKTTLARAIAQATAARYVAFSAVLSGVKDVKQVMVDAAAARQRDGARTVVFVDEIHRFNRAQQDAFLPHVEAGDIVLIGATTENPSFEVNAALLSRSKVFVLQALTTDAVTTILERALLDESAASVRRASRSRTACCRRSRCTPTATPAPRSTSSNSPSASCPTASRGGSTREHLAPLVARRTLRYDKSGEEHYNLISALHKSLRNSDPDAAVYWLARMLESGEDLMYVARRLVRFASEDIGNADPQALVVADRRTAGRPLPRACRRPTRRCRRPRSTWRRLPRATPSTPPTTRPPTRRRRDEADPVPLHLRNAPTRLMKQLEYGKGYEYAHDAADAVTRHGLPAAGAAGPPVLPAHRSRVREGDRAAARRLAGDQEERRTPNAEC